MTAATSQSMTVVIPMAGEGSRFALAGYPKPKPFLPLFGRPMIEQVMQNLAYDDVHYVLIARRAHLEQEPETVAALEARKDVSIHILDELTEGTACTVLAARDLIAADRPVLIANSDQLVEGGVGVMLDDALERRLDGSIMVFRDAGDPKWSFARIDKDGMVVEVAEKKPISNLATVGIYYFGSGDALISAAEAMIAADDRVNGEFYTCPVYNYLIRDGGRVGVYEIRQDAMWGLGIPDDYEGAIASPAFQAAFAVAD